MMRPLRILLPYFLSCSTAATQVYFSEDFSSGVPPLGWTQEQRGQACQGWRQALDFRAWHADEIGFGDCDDLLISSSIDLSSASIAYLHFGLELNHANYLANHPQSSGNGETDVWVRVAGGPWQEAWTDCRFTEDEEHIFSLELPEALLGKADVQVAWRYFGNFAHETWLRFVQIDQSPVPPPAPPPPATVWSVPDLPITPVLAPYVDDLEVWAGVPPAHMTLNATDDQFAPDLEAWCDIGGTLFAAQSGTFALEMGLHPTNSGPSLKRNAMILYLDGGGIAELTLSCSLVNHGEESNAFDGIWISADGLNWYSVFAEAAWQDVLPILETWETFHEIPLYQTPVDTTGLFYLGFFQEDDFPYAMLDGIGVDDIQIQAASGESCMQLRALGSCPAPMTFEIAGAPAGSEVVLLWGSPGSFVQNDMNLPCFGTMGDVIGFPNTLDPPNIAGFFSPAGELSCFNVPFVPGSVCGRLRFQAMDLTNCCVSNFVDI